MLKLVPPVSDSRNDEELGRATESELLGRVGAGDRDAFAELYDVMAPRVLGLVRRVLVDHAQSEEVTQEVFLELWQTAPRFDASRGSAGSWILTMAHRRAIDRVRASQSGRDRDVKVGIRDLATPSDDVAEQVEISVESERVQLALGKLSELQRETITLAYYRGLSQSEVSEKLGVPLGTVKTRMRDGMIRLRDELGAAHDRSA